MFWCVSCVRVCWDLVFEYVRDFQMLMSMPGTQCECSVHSVIVCVCVCVWVCVFAENNFVCLYEKVDGCFCVFLVYVCVRTTFIGMSGQFQVLMALQGTV